MSVEAAVRTAIESYAAPVTSAGRDSLEQCVAEVIAAQLDEVAVSSYARVRRHLVEGDLCYCVPPYTDTRAPHKPGQRVGCLTAAAALELAEQVAGGAP